MVAVDEVRLSYKSWELVRSDLLFRDLTLTRPRVRLIHDGTRWRIAPAAAAARTAPGRRPRAAHAGHDGAAGHGHDRARRQRAAPCGGRRVSPGSTASCR